MMILFQDSEFARNVRRSTTGPDGTALGNLRHALEMFADASDHEMVLTASRRVYPPGPGVYETATGVTLTGLTFGDLRELLASIDGADDQVGSAPMLEELGAADLVEDHDGAPYPDVAQGRHPAAVVLRKILNQHRIDRDDCCRRCRVSWPCSTVQEVVNADQP